MSFGDELRKSITDSTRSGPDTNEKIKNEATLLYELIKIEIKRRANAKDYKVYYNLIFPRYKINFGLYELIHFNYYGQEVLGEPSSFHESFYLEKLKNINPNIHSITFHYLDTAGFSTREAKSNVKLFWKNVISLCSKDKIKIMRPTNRAEEYIVEIEL
ncbi:MAG: hypothetical protein MR210_03455 [Erysipelotrichaceae bacterium]|nr:hypothetical protein [Erysipelotrichaceae bacterium]MDY5251166.1 hypothetical protein [Erysipelotrichaceae bacterium]